MLDLIRDNKAAAERMSTDFVAVMMEAPRHHKILHADAGGNENLIDAMARAVHQLSTLDQFELAE